MAVVKFALADHFAPQVRVPGLPVRAPRYVDDFGVDAAVEDRDVDRGRCPSSRPRRSARRSCAAPTATGADGSFGVSVARQHVVRLGPRHVRLGPDTRPAPAGPIPGSTFATVTSGRPVASVRCVPAARCGCRLPCSVAPGLNPTTIRPAPIRRPFGAVSSSIWAIWTSRPAPVLDGGAHGRLRGRRGSWASDGGGDGWLAACRPARSSRSARLDGDRRRANLGRCRRGCPGRLRSAAAPTDCAGAAPARDVVGPAAAHPAPARPRRTPGNPPAGSRPCPRRCGPAARRTPASIASGPACVTTLPAGTIATARLDPSARPAASPPPRRPP